MRKILALALGVLSIAGAASGAPITSYPIATQPYNSGDAVIGTQGSVTKQFTMSGIQSFSGGYSPSWSGSTPYTIPKWLGNTVQLTDFAPHLDGSTDDSAALQACVNAAPNGACVLPQTAFAMAIATEVTVTNGALILGVNKGQGHDAGPSQEAGCHIKWTGSAAGTMIYIGASGSATQRPSGGGIIGCWLDGNSDTANVGLEVGSIDGAIFDVFVSNTAVNGVHSSPSGASLAEAADVQHNTFRIFGDMRGSSDGSIMTADGTLTANTSFNDILVWGYYKNAVGLQMLNSDNNNVTSFTYQAAGGSATSGIVCAANANIAKTCRQNTFGRVTGSFVTGVGITFQGTASAANPSIGNSVAVLDASNGFTISIGTAATVSYLNNSTLAQILGGGVTAPSLATSGASGAQIIVGTSGSVGSSSPSQILMDGSFSSAAGANPKFCLLGNGSTCSGGYGIGISGSVLNIDAPIGASVIDYINAVPLLTQAAALLSTPTPFVPGSTVFASLGTFDPAPAVGHQAIITDASACTANANVTTGGGTIHSCPVVYNGANWVALVTH